MKKMTATQAGAIKKKGKYLADETLYLMVNDKGGKSWMQRLMVNHRRRDYGLGSFKLVTLSQARGLAFENRKLARRGVDPLAEKRKAKVPTFREASEKTFESLQPRWRNATTARNWKQSLEKHVYPVIGDMPIDQIGREQILQILVPIWSKTPEVSRRVKQRIHATLKWAMAHGHTDLNAVDLVAGALPVMPKVREHFRALDYRQIPQAIQTIQGSRASLSAKLCLQFTILTAARGGETRGAVWPEIDLEGREWRVPANRMKGHKEHRVPLSEAAIRVLEEANVLKDRSGLIFPSPSRPGMEISNMTMTKLLRTSGLAEKGTVHGFRSSFRDWCAERSGVPREIAEAALAHVVLGVEGDYFRSDLYERRVRLMQKWGNFATGTTAAKVVKLRG